MRTASLAVAALVLLGAPPALAEQMTLYSYAAGDHFVEVGREGGIGDMIVWDGELQDEPGNRLGSDTGSCIRVDAESTHVCTIVIDYDGHGIINLSGVQRPEPAPSILTIVGGTGAYEGITGSLVSTPVEDRARFKYEVEFRTD